MTTRFVIVQRTNQGRERALPGISFPSQEQAQNHINVTIAQRLHYRYRVSERIIKEKIANPMHCQCCGRAIFAETGLIAHHGYQRPGHGWQTNSCFGAKRLPWEVDRAALGDLIDYLATRLREHRKNLAEVNEETRAVSFSSQIYNRETRKYFTHNTSFTRAEFPDVLKRNEYGVFSAHRDHFFNEYKERDVIERQDIIDRTKRHIEELQRRYDRWQQTHIRANDAWVKLDPTSINNGD